MTYTPDTHAGNLLMEWLAWIRRGASGGAALGVAVTLVLWSSSSLLRAEQIEVTLAGIDPRGDEQVVLFLVEAKGKKMLPISVSPDQAESIYRVQAGLKTPRPLTHELMISVLGALGAKLQRVNITELRQGTFYADLVLESGGKLVRVDARPSDAIALALRAPAPIYAETALLMPFESSPRPGMEPHPLLSSLGLHLQDLTDELARFFEVPGGSGVLVAEAATDGPASRCGVTRGDVIRDIGGVAVGSVAEALAALRAAGGNGKGVEIRLLRAGRERGLKLAW